MSRSERKIHLGLFLLGTGSHTAGWRQPGALDTFQDIEALQAIAREAERGLFDLIFVGDNLNADPTSHPSYTARLEPLTMLAALAVSTRHVGLGATASTTYGDPFTVARAFASLDHISHGRAAWNAVTSASPAAGANFGIAHPSHAERYARAGEFIDVVRGLWDCWDADAIVADAASGLYIDPAKVRSLNHEGPHFRVKGPLNIGRAPQGRPVILQAGGSEAGQALAARTADVVFSVVQDFDEAKSQYDSLKALMPRFGRAPEDVVVLPGVMPVVGRTDREAYDKLERLQGFINPATAMTMLSERFGTDMSGFDLDEPMPDLGASDSYHAFAKVLLSKARREGLRLRDVLNLNAAARGHWVLCGSADRVADTLQHWFENGAADGFNVMPAHFPEGFSDFIDLVVPRLQERGLYRTGYEDGTLRVMLGTSTG